MNGQPVLFGGCNDVLCWIGIDRGVYAVSRWGKYPLPSSRYCRPSRDRANRNRFAPITRDQGTGNRLDIEFGTVIYGKGELSFCAVIVGVSKAEHQFRFE